VEVRKGEAGAVFSEWEHGGYGDQEGMRLRREAGGELGTYSAPPLRILR
jgi:hypothetical protein